MAISQALRGLMADTVTIEPYSTQNVNAEPTPGSGVTYTCRVVGRRKLVRDTSGREAVSMVQVYVDRLVSIDPLSRITLPARFTPSQPPIIAVEMFPDEQGTSGSMAHTVIYC